MSATFREWDIEAERMNPEARMKMLQALKTLEQWPFFKDNYGWTGFSTVALILENADIKMTLANHTAQATENADALVALATAEARANKEHSMPLTKIRERIQRIITESHMTMPSNQDIVEAIDRSTSLFLVGRANAQAFVVFVY